MSCCWNCCGYRRSRYNLTDTQNQAQAQAQLQGQLQLQGQDQDQDQDQDQNQRNVFKEIGNVNIKIDNENIAVAILAILGVFLGSLDSAGVQTMLDRYLPSRTV